MAVADAIRESMSAVMDGEGSEMDLARVLKAVEDDPDARAYWQRLQCNRTVLRTGAPDISIDVSAGVRAALTTTPVRQRRVGPLGSLAVAASVTMAVVFGGQLMVNDGVSSPATQVPGVVVPVAGAVPVQARYGVAPASQPARRQVNVAATPSVSKVYEQLARERFVRYGIEHAESTAAIQPNVFVPYARIPQQER